MFRRTDCANAAPRIVATARFIPTVRGAHHANAEASSPRAQRQVDAVMQSIYGDTLRWRDECQPSSGNGSSLAPVRRADEPIAAQSDLSLSDMALRAARTLYETAPPQAAPDQIIVCSTSFEHDLALSCAGRLHSELGSSRPPFAIGQLQDVSFATALDVTLAMMAVDAALNTVLIVAAERWSAPFSRHIDLHTALADGAAAVLVARHPTPGWRVRGLTICTPTTQAASSVIAKPVDSATVFGAINKALMQAELRAAQMDWIVSAKIDSQLMRTVSAHGELPLERIWHGDDDTRDHLCAAHTPACLAGITRAVSPHDGQHLLVCSAGFHGQVACMILEFCEARS
ncbi:MAG: 3-oxoacyl-ACP synthase [Burkholderia sp.]|jgi:3-oxoacyl-[acyl-carrier-protein] synthase III|nr:3-oxoacyl-ACP synthase [Methylobacterium sp.]MCA3779105.1 3-oxoacyl-ACP synthase [Burkholderia sp.]MCA3787560.1 3-oxoacyl-ACP synthase [Burkholderia sp.]MCA3798589.1 3-oxoacyl-ACP synthase [Burkholderia sp.]MCA3800697.1 3-oxoacyl-ACP synthase [Burkholderia sp.]